jgi:hypothetical protein
MRITRFVAACMPTYEAIMSSNTSECVVL